MGTGVHQSCASAIVDRLRRATGAHSDSELARILGVGKMTVSNWRSRDSRPYPQCLQVAQELGVSLDWLLLGQGEMRRTELAIAEPQGGAYAADIPDGRKQRLERERDEGDKAEQIVRWLREWWPRASEQERAWLDEHLRRTVIEYRDWRNAHKK